MYTNMDSQQQLLHADANVEPLDIYNCLDDLPAEAPVQSQPDIFIKQDLQWENGLDFAGILPEDWLANYSPELQTLSNVSDTQKTMDVSHNTITKVEQGHNYKTTIDASPNTKSNTDEDIGLVPSLQNLAAFPEHFQDLSGYIYETTVDVPHIMETNVSNLDNHIEKVNCIQSLSKSPTREIVSRYYQNYPGTKTNVSNPAGTLTNRPSASRNFQSTRTLNIKDPNNGAEYEVHIKIIDAVVNKRAENILSNYGQATEFNSTTTSCATSDSEDTQPIGESPSKSPSSFSSNNDKQPKARKPRSGPQNPKGDFPCKECNRNFFSQRGLKQHINVLHSGERPHLCTVCGKSFREQQQLKDHEKRHQSDGKHKCTDCSKSFHQSYSLKTHFERHHSQPSLECSVCGKGFVRKDRLSAHLRSHENNTIKPRKKKSSNGHGDVAE